MLLKYTIFTVVLSYNKPITHDENKTICDFITLLVLVFVVLLIIHINFYYFRSAGKE